MSYIVWFYVFFVFQRKEGPSIKIFIYFFLKTWKVENLLSAREQKPKLFVNQYNSLMFSFYDYITRALYNDPLNWFLEPCVSEYILYWPISLAA